MLFQTLEFLFLMIAVLLSVILIRAHLLQMILLLIASWIFYMSWNPIFIFMLMFTTFNDYILGLGIDAAKTKLGKRIWLMASIATNLGMLAIFKYFNFFVDSINHILAWSNSTHTLTLFQITLPVGISFYTFHSMGYVTDLYRGKTKVEKSFLRFAIYVAFFPQLVAGPILRSYQFLPQLDSAVDLLRKNLRSGLNLFIVGLIKKILIADHMAPLVNFIFERPQGMSSPVIWLGALAFGVQIYCDFSGYTDMAIGCARMLGYEIPINFNYPYFAHTITDYWRRWHISLSSWLRDYLYIPLGGNRHGTAKTYRNLMLTMGLGGLWHGAGWNFLVWGLYQGGLLSIERLFGIGADKKTAEAVTRRGVLRWADKGGVICRWIFVQYLVFFGWLMFRVTNKQDLIYCIKKYLVFDFDFKLSGLGLGNVNPFLIVAALVLFIIFHGISWRIGGIANQLDRMRWPVRSIVYATAVFAMIALWPTGRTAFIYFQF